MGLSLCHSVPRDALILVAIALFVVAFILEAIVVGRHSSTTSAGFLTDKGGADPSARIGFIAGHPATYAGATAAVLVKHCDPSASVLLYNCARFAEAYHFLNGLVLASLITCVIFVLVSLFVVVRVSRTTTQALFNLQCLAGVPAALQCAALVIFFVRVVPNAKDDFIVASFAGDRSVRLAFHRRYATNLMIAATVFVCVGWLAIVAKYFAALCTRQRLKRKNVEKQDMAAMMKMHLVNDDWQRQKQILRTHAKSVQVEMEIRKEDEEQMGRHSHNHSSNHSIHRNPHHHADNANHAPLSASPSAPGDHGEGASNSPASAGVDNRRRLPHRPATSSDAGCFQFKRGNSGHGSGQRGTAVATAAPTEAESTTSFSEVDVRTPPRGGVECHDPMADEDPEEL